jgi:acyl-CoA oxidase
MAAYDPTKWPFTLKPAAPDGATILAYERSRSNINVEELSKHLLTPTFLERQTRILAILQKDKLFSKTTQANLSRPDRYKLGLARGKRLRQLIDQYHWDDDDYKMAEYLVDDVLPYHLHTAMFVAAVREQADDAQRAYWMPKLESWEVVGAYAQTELGHGSNVRGIECEARWDQTRKEFALHSPTLTASKWWNGTLGRTATHAVVIARLLVPDKGGNIVDHGPRPFIIRVRDAGTHQPPPSIVVGDIGAKYGYASMDNAYMLFNQHRVRHSSLLCRYATVNPESGVYTRPKNPASVYGTMTRNRSIIVMNARLALARAVTVAVRYLCIRRQFRDQDADSSTSPEVNVLDYSTVQIRVLPLLATLFALNYSGAAMWDLWQRTRGSNELDNDHAELNELHVTSSGLKSLATELAGNGIETCRRAMGGHGYGGGSGLVQLNADYLSKPTVEGDNWMITQQVARALLKKIREKPWLSSKKALSRTDEYLRRYGDSKVQKHAALLSDDTSIVEAFECRAASLAFKAYHAREVEGRSWNSLLIQFHNLSRSYSQAMLVSNFHTAVIGNSSSDAITQEVLLHLFRLFALTTMDAEAREFQSCGAVSSEDLDILPAKILELMQSLRPHCVRLVDAWAVPDYLLDSALGRHDGKAYEDLFHRAHVLNPLNRETFNPDYKNNEIVHGSGDADRILSKL